jgi:cobalt-zinc-cadmium resistance protein CzcA
MLSQENRFELVGEPVVMSKAGTHFSWSLALLVGLALILLATAFDSLKDALVVSASATVTLIGGIWALRLTETPLSGVAATGFLTAAGLAAQGTALLVWSFNSQRSLGFPIVHSVLRGVELWARPIFLTVLVATAAMGPAAVADSIGSQSQRPLSLVIVGGMVVALFLMPYLVSVLYSFFPAPRGVAPDWQLDERLGDTPESNRILGDIYKY